MILSDIFVYPVKSCAGMAVDETDLDRFGPAGDRRWMLVDGAGICLTQRDLPRMALIAATPVPGGLELELAGERLRVAAPGAGAARLEVTVWADRVPARVAPAADAALSGFLDRDCRLVYMPEDTRRPVDTRYARQGETVSFADGFPLLLVSQASLDDLNSRLPEPVPMNRFRPNLVVSGCGPFAEDDWRRLRIGELELEVAKPCSRCVMPSIVQETAGRDGTINRVLASFRRRDGVICFGQNLLYRHSGRLRVGDPVEIIQ